MQIGLDHEIEELASSMLQPMHGASANELVDQIRNIHSFAQDRIERISKMPEAKRSPEFKTEKETFLKFMQSIPAGPLSVYCQTQWREAERKMRRVDEQGRVSMHLNALQKMEILKEVQSHVSKAVFANAYLPNQVVAAVTGVSPVKEVHAQFAAALKRMIHSLHSFRNYEDRSGLEDASISFSMRLSREISIGLLTEGGKLNIGVIPYIKAALFPEGKKLRSYETIICRVLGQIDSSWQPLLDGVVKPNPEASASESLIRADLNLNSHVPLTDLHAKQAVLAALLSHHSQGPMGDCFSVSLGMKLQDEFLKNALRQYGELIQYGSIGKLINGKSERFFFKNTISEGNLQKSITVDPTGKLASGMVLWSTPNFKFAFRAMGIDPPTKFVAAALKALGAVEGSIKTTPDAVIQAFAAASLSDFPKSSLQGQIDAGRYAFTVDNRVLRAFETTLAAMAEAKRSEYIRNHLLQSINTALQPTFNHLEGIYAAGPVAQFRDAMEHSILDRIRYVYNAAIQDIDVSRGGSSISGGYELYDKHPMYSYQIGSRIETPYQFQQLILDAVRKAGQTFNASNLMAIASAVETAVKSSGFLKQVLIAYDPANEENIDPVSHFRQLARTPMCSQDKGDPIEIEEIDTGLLFSPDLKTARLDHASDLFNWLLGLASWKEKTERYIPSKTSDQPDSKKAFHLAIDIEEIGELVKSGQKAADWEKSHLLDPGKALSSWIVDIGTRQNTIQAMMHLLAKQSYNAAAQFQQGAIPLANAPMPLSQFASSLVRVLGQCLPGVDPYEVGFLVDSTLMQNLPDAMIKPIVQNSVRLSLIGSERGSKDIYFCVYYNVRTQSLSFGTIDKDRTKLQPMNEREWLNADWNLVL